MSQVFKNGHHASLHYRIKPDTMMWLDASAGGTVMIKIVDEVRELIDNMSLNEYRAHTDDEDVSKNKVCFSFIT